MKKLLYLLPLVAILTACQGSSDIRHVKDSPCWLSTDENLTFGEFLEKHTPKDASVKWKSFEPKYGFTPSQRCVQLTVRRPNYKYKKLDIQFIFDRSTNAIEPITILINGKQIEHVQRENEDNSIVEDFFELPPKD